MEQPALETWVGRTETLADIAALAPLHRLAALLDHKSPPWRTDEVPPLGHWLYFLPNAAQSELDQDGHPRRGGFLPPVALPRRMWAGGRLNFLEKLPIGAAIERRSKIAAVTPKSGAAGAMVFVTVLHEIFAGGQLAISEEHDIVYREPQRLPARKSDAGPFAVLNSDIIRHIAPDPTQLFRFSALTFNAHRIHYDRDYAKNVEGYPGLVAHGPYIATLLMDHFLRENPQTRVTSFTFRAQRPLFDTAPFDLCLRPTPAGADLWALDPAGDIAMTAVITATKSQP